MLTDMKTDLVSVEKTGRIAMVRFDRGDQANALSFAIMRELTKVAHELADNPDLCAVVLTGRIDNFCLGMDLKDDEVVKSATARLSERRIMLKTGPRMCRAWEELDPLTIVAIEGWCVGGGTALAVSCDLRLIGSGGHFYVPEVERGFNMSWGSVPRITNLVGPARAKRIVVLAEKLDAARAVDWGLADEAVPDGTAVEAALEMARRAASLPPNGVRLCKATINAHVNALNAATSHADMDQFALTQNSEDCAEGLRAFLETRDPVFTGR
jgi:enoyl-CoA hydratase/carnithine racemase